MAGHSGRDTLEGIRAAFQSGERSDVERLVANVKEAALSCEEAQLFFDLVRDWHVQGYGVLQKQICERVIEALPRHHEAMQLLGFHAQEAGEYEGAERWFRAALAVQPDYAFARLACAQLLMRRTAFAEGKEEYEARFDAVTEGSGADWRGLPIPRWRGEDLEGKRLYLWAEQGVGDMVMLAGFLPQLLAEKPAYIMFGVYPKLISIFSRSFPSLVVEDLEAAALQALGPVAEALVPQLAMLEAQGPLPFPTEMLRAAYDARKRYGVFDYAAPIGDLLVYGPLPQPQPAYLRADPARVAAMRAWLEVGRPARCIGISWATSNIREITRNAPLTVWEPLLALPGHRFISLQHGASQTEMDGLQARTGLQVETAPGLDFLQDAEGLAALIAALDGIVTIDNSNAHLAGALGVKTLLMLPAGANYRWPEQADGGNLWYQSVSAIRQRQFGEWGTVIEEARIRLEAETRL